MEPLEVIAAVSAAISLIKELTPQVQAIFASGQIPDEDQAKVIAQYRELKDHVDLMFAGTEWNKSDGTKSGSQLP